MLINSGFIYKTMNRFNYQVHNFKDKILAKYQDFLYSLLVMSHDH